MAANYEVLRIFDAKFAGDCVVCGRQFRKGNRVAKLQRADNPYVQVQKLACSKCYPDMPEASQ